MKPYMAKGDGRRRRRRRKIARRRAALAAKVDAVPDELLELVFLRLPSPLHLIRAACTCKRWRRIIAADGGGLIRSLHGATSSHVVGHYIVEDNWPRSRPPGRNPIFAPSSFSPWADILAARDLALDFLPPPPPEFSNSCWELSDIRGGLLLLSLFSNRNYLSRSPSPARGLLVCDPLARRYMDIPLPTWFHESGCLLGAFLRDGDGDGEDDASCTPVSLSNFRVTCVLCHSSCVAKASTFSSVGGSHYWTSGAAICGDYLAKHDNIHFASCSDDGSVASWTTGVFYVLLSLDKETAELSASSAASSVPSFYEYVGLWGKRSGPPVYTYKLPWPPTIRACLS